MGHKLEFDIFNERYQINYYKCKNCGIYIAKDVELNKELNEYISSRNINYESLANRTCDEIILENILL